MQVAYSRFIILRVVVQFSAVVEEFVLFLSAMQSVKYLSGEILPLYQTREKILFAYSTFRADDF